MMVSGYVADMLKYLFSCAVRLLIEWRAYLNESYAFEICV